MIYEMPKSASRCPNWRKVRKSGLLQSISLRRERELCAKRVLAGEKIVFRCYATELISRR